MDILPILATLRRHKITAALLILQIALTCAIVCNAVFLITQRLQRMDMPSGIAERELLHLELADIGRAGDEKARDAEDRAALRQVPGVTDVASVNQVPFGGSSNNSGIKLDPQQKQPTLNMTTYYGENIAQTLGVQLVAGRLLRPDEYMDFDTVVKAIQSGDTKPLTRVLVITQAMAERLWPGQNPLGKELYIGSDTPLQVVGVVKSLIRPSVWDDAMAQYSGLLPVRMSNSNYLIRTAPGDRERVLQAAIAALKKTDPHRVVINQHLMSDMRRDFYREDRAMAVLLGGVCVALLVVTALGIVGLGSFWVAQRRRQIGVRRALGATRGHILHYFQTENFLLATLGIALGMVLAYGINLFLMHRYELPRLPAFYLPVGAVALWLIGQAAVLGPALRAAAVPPVVATRSA
ncbi:MAG: ABC transporter permease [Rhodanobacter sp. SCN 68-63]|nr:MAG: ABC transporter permease [Rhodanobacter sp. SCN 68-63]